MHVESGSHFIGGGPSGFVPQPHPVTNDDDNNGSFQEKEPFLSDEDFLMLKQVSGPQNNSSMQELSESNDACSQVGSQFYLNDSPTPQDVQPIQYPGNVNVNLRQFMAAQLNDITQAVVKHEDINFAILMFQSIKNHASTLIDLQSTKRPVLGQNPPTSNYGTS